MATEVLESSGKFWKLPVENCTEVNSKECDVLIIGSGVLGCTFARKILDNDNTKGKSIIIVDVGAQLSKNPGENVKNAIFFQKDINSFAGIISAHQHLLSVPSNKSIMPTLDPSAYQFDIQHYQGFVSHMQYRKILNVIIIIINIIAPRHITLITYT